MKKFLAAVLCLSMSMAAVPAFAAEQKAVHAGTSEELVAALQSNTAITLDAKDYAIDWVELNGLENVTIQGKKGTHFVGNEEGFPFILISECKNVTISNIAISHNTKALLPDLYGAGYDGGMVAVSDSKDIVIDGCEIYSHGSYGLDTMTVENMTVKNTVIRDCDVSAALITDGNYVFENCTFRDNGSADYDYGSAIETGAYGIDAEIKFTGCTFSNNKHQLFMNDLSGTNKYDTLISKEDNVYKWKFGEHTITAELDNCTFSGNGWSEPSGTSAAKPVETKPVETKPAKTASGTAYASTQKVEVDGKKVTFEAYALKDASGNPTNYIKLRDVAAVLNGSAAQFEVGWDGKVIVTTGKAYTASGSEMTTPYSGDRAYKNADADTIVDGTPADLDAILLTDDAGKGYTYYKLRDLGAVLGFNVDWTAERGIFITTK